MHLGPGGIGIEGKIPRAQQALRPTHRIEGYDSEQRQDQQNTEHYGSLHRAGTGENQIAESLVGADELGDDRADHGQRDGDLQAAKDVRQRPWQSDAPEYPQLAGIERAG